MRRHALSPSVPCPCMTMLRHVPPMGIYETLYAFRDAFAAYYRRHYGADITSDNVMVFAGGRPGLAAVLLFLEAGIRVRIASTEYTPYFDLLRLLGRPYDTVASGPENGFAPPVAEL